MSDLKGTNIAAPIMPFSSLDTYPTHESIYGKGGYKAVAGEERGGGGEEGAGERGRGQHAYLAQTGYYGSI